MQLFDYTQFCDEWLGAWTGNRPDRLITFYAESIYYRDPANPNGINGRADLFKYLERLLAKNPDWKWERKEIYPHYQDTGFTLKYQATIPVKDKVHMLDGLDIVLVSEGAITRNEVYFDTALLVR